MVSYQKISTDQTNLGWLPAPHIYMIEGPVGTKPEQELTAGSLRGSYHCAIAEPESGLGAEVSRTYGNSRTHG